MTITKELKRYEVFMIMSNFSASTQQMYLRTLKEFLRYAKKTYPKKPISQEIASQYLIRRAKKGKSWPTINCDYSALRKYFREVAELQWVH